MIDVVIILKGVNMGKKKKLYKLDGLRIDMISLLEILEKALKCDDFEEGKGADNLYLVGLIKNKFRKMSEIIQFL